jgi:hypothetical protein
LVCHSPTIERRPCTRDSVKSGQLSSWREARNSRMGAERSSYELMTSKGVKLELMPRKLL